VAREARVTFQVDLPDQPVMADYDATQIEQVLVNLIQNGIQAMPRGGRLSVRLREQDGAALISVQDQGQGIPADQLGRIFEPFFTTKPAGQGTGLGLAVSAGIVAEHHGRIDAASQVGQGSVFTVYLPLKQPAVAERAPVGAEG
jgi:signal transduction histidine kinase